MVQQQQTPLLCHTANEIAFLVYTWKNLLWKALRTTQKIATIARSFTLVAGKHEGCLDDNLLEQRLDAGGIVKHVFKGMESSAHTATVVLQHKCMKS